MCRVKCGFGVGLVVWVSRLEVELVTVTAAAVSPSTMAGREVLARDMGRNGAVRGV